MTVDPIVEEIKRYREAYAVRFNHDTRAIVEDVRTRQGKNGRRIVQRVPRTPQVHTARQHSAT